MEGLLREGKCPLQRFLHPKFHLNLPPRSSVFWNLHAMPTLLPCLTITTTWHPMICSMSCFLTLQPTLPLLFTWDDITCGIEQRHVTAGLMSFRITYRRNRMAHHFSHCNTGGLERTGLKRTPSTSNILAIAQLHCYQQQTQTVFPAAVLRFHYSWDF